MTTTKTTKTAAVTAEAVPLRGLEGYRVIWDGGTSLTVIGRRGKVLTPLVKSGKILYNLFLSPDAMRPRRINAGRIIFCLRHNIPITSDALYYKKFKGDGSLYDYTEYRRSYSNFTDIEQLERTVRVIRSIVEGDPVPALEYFYANREVIIGYCCRQHLVSTTRPKVEAVFDEAVDLTVRKLSEMRFRVIKKLSWHLCDEIVRLLRIRKLPHNDNIQYTEP